MSDPVQADHSPTQQGTEQTDEHSLWSNRVTPTTVRAFCALGIALVLGDLVTTIYGLEIGLRERNPFVVAVIGRFGVAGLVGLKLVTLSWVALIWRVLGRRYGLAAMAGVIVPQGTAVVLNVVTILNA